MSNEDGMDEEVKNILIIVGVSIVGTIILCCLGYCLVSYLVGRMNRITYDESSLRSSSSSKNEKKKPESNAIETLTERQGDNPEVFPERDNVFTENDNKDEEVGASSQDRDTTKIEQKGNVNHTGQHDQSSRVNMRDDD